MAVDEEVDIRHGFSEGGVLVVAGVGHGDEQVCVAEGSDRFFERRLRRADDTAFHSAPLAEHTDQPHRESVTLNQTPALKWHLTIAGEVGGEQRNLPLAGGLLQPVHTQDQITNSWCETVDSTQCKGIESQLRLATLLGKPISGDLAALPGEVACIHHQPGAGEVVDDCGSSGQTAHWILRSTTGLDFTIEIVGVDQGERLIPHHHRAGFFRGTARQQCDQCNRAHSSSSSSGSASLGICSRLEAFSASLTAFLLRSRTMSLTVFSANSLTR